MVLEEFVGCERVLQISVPEVLQSIPKIARVLDGTLQHYQPMLEFRPDTSKKLSS